MCVCVLGVAAGDVGDYLAVYFRPPMCCSSGLWKEVGNGSLRGMQTRLVVCVCVCVASCCGSAWFEVSVPGTQK